MKEPFMNKVKRKIKQILCIKHDWRLWVNGEKKSCRKCDKTVPILKENE